MIIDIIINNMKLIIYIFNHMFLIKSRYYISEIKVKDNILKDLDSPPTK